MKRILIVEDDPYIAELQRDYFQLHDYEADLSLDGSEGLNKALHGGYDLVILDLQLPGIDGFEICRQIREKLDVPILIVSAKKKKLIKFEDLASVPMTL